MLELLSIAEMAEADRRTIADGTAGIALMENAGRAVADAAVGARRVIVVAGPGNNGGDGFVAARLLVDRGVEVRVLFHGKRNRLKGDAAIAAGRWKGPTKPARPEAIRDCDLIIDALFGAGLDRPIEGDARALVAAMNASGVRIVAVDVPSGINGTTGQVMGAAVTATHTVTFFRRKPGHVLLPGRLHCGGVSVAQIGIPGSVLGNIAPKAFLNRPALWRHVFPRASAEGHKYSRGHAVVVSGPLTTTGAARLAARGALRAGAGLVTIASPREALAVNGAASLAVMVRPVDGAKELAGFLADTRRNAIVLGPGGGVGAAMRNAVRTALDSAAAVVLDADALTSFAEDPAALFSAIGERRMGEVVLTPHAGEFSRIFNEIEENIKLISKLEKARAAARLCGAIVLLKGSDTVIAAPDGRASIADNAPPWLATAGAGDILAGMIAGLIAQHMPAFEAVSAAVWLHGEAARILGPGLVAEDLPEVLPRVLGALEE